MFWDVPGHPGTSRERWAVRKSPVPGARDVPGSPGTSRDVPGARSSAEKYCSALPGCPGMSQDIPRQPGSAEQCGKVLFRAPGMSQDALPGYPRGHPGTSRERGAVHKSPVPRSRGVPRTSSKVSICQSRIARPQDTAKTSFHAYIYKIFSRVPELYKNHAFTRKYGVFAPPPKYARVNMGFLHILSLPITRPGSTTAYQISTEAPRNSDLRPMTDHTGKTEEKCIVGKAEFGGVGSASPLKSPK